MTSLCIPNIGPHERLRRLRIGYVSLACATVATTVLILSDASRGWRLLVFLPLMLAAFCFLQVRAETCVALAARGMRNLDSGDEPIRDTAELNAVKAQARRINLQAPVVAAAVTAVLFAIP